MTTSRRSSRRRANTNRSSQNSHKASMNELTETSRGESNVDTMSHSQSLKSRSKKAKTTSTTSKTEDSTKSMDHTQFGSNKTSSARHYGPKRLVWRDIHADVVEKVPFWKIWAEKKVSTRVILDGVSGYANTGEVTFIMGASGAGKSTLLNILTQRNLKGLRVFGDISIDKQYVDSSQMRRISAYVQQEDMFLSELTVREQLIFTAHLRMRSLSDREKKSKVDTMLKEMGLHTCRDTLIGGTGIKSISKGEMKRLAFACEIITNPDILFCDEPTSGLDSFMALQVVNVLSSLARKGKIVVATIHQPSTQVFLKATSLILMAAGRVAFQGPSEDIGPYLEQQNYPCKEYISVSDHFMTVFSKTESEKEELYNARIDKLIDAYEECPYALDAHQITHAHVSSWRRRYKEDLGFGMYNSSWWTQFRWLFYRGLKVVLRNPMVLRVRLFQCVVMSFIVGLMYFQMELRGETIMNYKGVAFMALRDMNMFFLFPCVFVFTSELPVIQREYHGNMYHPSAYFMGKNIADSLQYLIHPTVYSLFVYFMIGFDLSFWQYMRFWIVCLSMAITSTSVGYAGACIFGDLSTASAALPLFTIPVMTFGGFFIDLRTVPDYFRPLMYISWYKYAYEANVVNFFENVGQIKDCNVNATMTSIQYCAGATGSDLVRWFAWDELTEIAIGYWLKRKSATTQHAHPPLTNNHNYN